jgi:glycosyltransferase involved in cell wall biosynthesis
MSFLIIASFPESILHFRGHLLTALQSKGLKVHVAAPHLIENIALRKQLQKLGFVVHSLHLRRTGTNPLTDALTFWQLFRLMCAIRPTYILCYTIKPVIYGSLAAWLARVPNRFALITGLGYAFQGRSIARVVMRELVQWLYGLAIRRTHKVFFQNPDDQIFFQSLGLLSPYTPSCVVNGSGVDLETFAVVPLPPEPHFLLIARLLGAKGVREYAKAAEKVRLLFPRSLFSLVGWYDENPDSIDLKELDDWVKAGTINFLGRLSDVRPAMANCSVFVLPSYREGTPRTVLEAMAMGRAVITTDVPGCRETVVNGENGFLVPAKSVDDLADAMIKFLIDPNLALRMGQLGRQLAELKYDVHEVNIAMLKEMGIK